MFVYIHLHTVTSLEIRVIAISYDLHAPLNTLLKYSLQPLVSPSRRPQANQRNFCVCVPLSPLCLSPFPSVHPSLSSPCWSTNTHIAEHFMKASPHHIEVRIFVVHLQPLVD